MPFRTLHGDKTIWPDQTNDAEVLVCPACGDAVTVATGHARNGSWVSRHFRHISDVSCGGSETDTHRMMKYVASQTCPNTFDDATVEREARSKDSKRRADVLVSFSGTHHVLGKGLAVEVQYRNESKDKLAVSREYLIAGYSVLGPTKKISRTTGMQFVWIR